MRFHKLQIKYKWGVTMRPTHIYQINQYLIKLDK